jgi:sugar phosphate isomerase/epimerase
MGIWWGMTNKEYKAYLTSVGLTINSTHCNVTKDFERKAAEAAEIGIQYMINPFIGPQKTLDDYKKKADEFNKHGEICKKAGLRFAYHNHDYSFKQQDGKIPQDILLENTNPDTVDFEMDIYWVVTAGADPISFLEKYPNRFRLSHIKDRLKTIPIGSKEDASCDLGTGIIDFGKILPVAMKNGMKHFIVEQELYTNSTPLKSAEVDAAYLKKLAAF